MKSLDLKEIDTVVINLDHQPERLVEMDEVLGKVGISYTRFPAISNQTVTGTTTFEVYRLC